MATKKSATSTAATTSAVEDAAAAIIQSDPEIRERIRGLVLTTIDRMEHTLTWGSPGARDSVVKAIVPGLMRGLARAEDSQKGAEMAEEFARLRQRLSASPSSPND